MVCLCSVDVLSESVKSIVDVLPVLVDQERLCSERGQEGPETPGEVQSVHVGSAIASLPDTENKDVDGIVQGAVTKAGQEGAGVERDERGTVGKC